LIFYIREFDEFDESWLLIVEFMSRMRVLRRRANVVALAAKLERNWSAEQHGEELENHVNVDEVWRDRYLSEIDIIWFRLAEEAS
jgi:hypothetical protein